MRSFLKLGVSLIIVSVFVSTPVFAQRYVAVSASASDSATSADAVVTTVTSRSATNTNNTNTNNTNTNNTNTNNTNTNNTNTNTNNTNTNNTNTNNTNTNTNTGDTNTGSSTEKTSTVCAATFCAPGYNSNSSTFSWLQPLFDTVKSLQEKLSGLLDKIKQLLRLYTDDDLAQQATSQTLTTKYTYADNPNISVQLQHLTSPIQVNQKVKVGIKASSTSCAIAKADFIVNGNILANATVEPFEFEWTPQTVGDYKIKVVVEDCQGLAAYATKTIKVIVGDGSNSDSTNDSVAQDNNDDSIIQDNNTGVNNSSKLSVQTELFKTIGSWSNQNLMAIVELENDGNASLLFVDSNTNEPVGRIKSVGGKQGNLVTSSDYKFVYFIAKDGYVVKIDLDKLEVVDSILVGKELNRIRLTDNGKVLGVTDNSDEVTLIFTESMMLGFNQNKFIGTRMKERFFVADLEAVGNSFIMPSKTKAIFYKIDTETDGQGSAIYMPKEIVADTGGDLIRNGFLSADKKYYIALMKNSSTAMVFDIAAGMKKIATFPVGKTALLGITVNNLIFIPSAEKITVVKPGSWQVVADINVPTPLAFLREFTANGKTYIFAKTIPPKTAQKYHEFYVIDVGMLKISKIIESTAGKYTSFPEVTFDKTKMYVAIPAVNKVHVYNLGTFKPIANIDSNRPLVLYSIGDKL